MSLHNWRPKPGRSKPGDGLAIRRRVDRNWPDRCSKLCEGVTIMTRGAGKDNLWRTGDAD
jgi:hypothetical protein